jgi:hypothetical protein
MALESLCQQEVEFLEQELLAKVPEFGRIGNKSLRTQLLSLGKWDADLYWEVRNNLIDRGLLVKGGGNGGSVRRPEATVEAPPGQGVAIQDGAPEKDAQFDERVPELVLYEPMAKVIREDWTKDFRLDSFILEVTAHQGARPTGGKWTRPDITLASYKTFAYVPGKHFDLVTFEIKPQDSIDITVVYEALAHRRAATRAFALLHVSEDKKDALEPVITEICSQAKQFGIGVIIARDPSDYDTWDEVVESVRNEPDPERLNDFLSQQVSQQFRETVVRWFR